MITPDFLITPYEVHACEDLRPSDSPVYAVAYWFEKMRGEKCIASNATIAEIAKVSERAVGGSLERLEKNGFIRRIYNPDGSRAEIKTLVSYTKREHKEEGDTGKPAEVVHKETPGEKAKRFFNSDGLYAKELIDKIVENGGNREEITKEMRKFYSYWTEPNKSGTKVRWQQQTNFDVGRRLGTWFNNKKGGFGKAGSGREI